MTANLQELIKVLQKISIKIADFKENYFFQPSKNYFQSNSEYLVHLQDVLEEELSWISSVLQVPQSCALVLSSIIRLYFRNSGIKTNFITYSDIESILDMPGLEIFYFELREPLYELEYRNIIEITKVDYHLVKVYGLSDRRQNDYFMIPAKPTFVPFGNTKIELSNSFINKLNFL